MKRANALCSNAKKTPVKIIAGDNLLHESTWKNSNKLAELNRMQFASAIMYKNTLLWPTKLIEAITAPRPFCIYNHNKSTA